MKEIKNKLKLYLDNNLIEQQHIERNLFSKLKCFFSDEKVYECENTSIPEVASDIKEFIEKHEEYSDFQTMLFKLIDNKNIKDSEVYNKVHIDRRLFSKIRSDKNYHPSKDTIILLALALELNENELDQLLESASYSLPKNNKYDLIIRFCFINKIYKITVINELLHEYNCKLFNY